MGLNAPEKLQSESPLLGAYQLLVEDLDYGSIEKCTDIAMLVKILRVLRSAQVGYYPDLIEFTESRIRSLSPSHIILTGDDNVWSKSEMGACGEWPEFDLTDLGSLGSMVSGDASNMPGLISLDITDRCDKFPVRQRTTIRNEADLQMSVDSDTKKQTEVEKSASSSTSSRIKSSDFTAWDKYDVEKELLKIDQQLGSEPALEGLTRQHKLPADDIHRDGMSEYEKQKVALREKEKGNEAYKSGDYAEAALYFSRSLSVLDSLVVINNRAQAYIKLKRFGEALCDLKFVVEREPQNVKARLRMATIHFERKDYDLAEKHAKAALDFCPTSKAASRILQQLADLTGHQTLKEPSWRLSTPKKGPLIEIIE